MDTITISILVYFNPWLGIALTFMVGTIVLSIIRWLRSLLS
jgi:hypothetical protein